MREKQKWPENDGFLRLARRSNRCTVLGPGVRAVFWVQGCPLRCPGCVAPETLPFAGGEVVPVSRLADEIIALNEIEGLTFSGGERQDRLRQVSIWAMAYAVHALAFPIVDGRLFVRGLDGHYCYDLRKSK